VGEAAGLDLAGGQFYPGVAGTVVLELEGGAVAVGQEWVLVEDDVEASCDLGRASCVWAIARCGGRT